DERALPRARRTGDADEIRAARAAEDAPNEVGARRILVLDERDRARDGARIPRQHALGQRRGHERESSWRAMTSRWISLVPSPMVVSLTSRKYFSAGYDLTKPEPPWICTRPAAKLAAPSHAYNVPTDGLTHRCGPRSVG